jgi:excinuclease UvrABC nuclease subunit
MLVPPSLRRRVAAELPGIGQQKSADVSRHFKTTQLMLEADVKEWRKVKGIGKTLAEKIVATVHSE